MATYSIIINKNLLALANEAVSGSLSEKITRALTYFVSTEGGQRDFARVMEMFRNRMPHYTHVDRRKRRITSVTVPNLLKASIEVLRETCPLSVFVMTDVQMVTVILTWLALANSTEGAPSVRRIMQTA